MGLRKWLLVSSVLFLSSTSPGWAGGLFLLPDLAIQSTGRGVPTVFQVRVVNATTDPRTIELVTDNICPGWAAIVTPATVLLPPSGQTNVELKVTPPVGWNDACTVDLQGWVEGVREALARLTTAVQYEPATPMVFTSFPPGQRLAVTNGRTNVTARLEWAHDLNGPWRRSWQGFELIDAPVSGTIYTAKPPRFYRFAADTASPGMVLVDEGSFVMGWTNIAEDSYPEHTVEIDAFYMDKYEVTVAQWHDVRAWANGNGYPDLTNGLDDFALYNHPVTQITWYDAVKWCNARSEREGLTPVYYVSRDMYAGNVYRTGETNLGIWQVNWHANGYRLPTEAEWEKAARGGLSGHYFPWRSRGGGYESHVNGSKANYWDSGDPFADSSPVGFYQGGQYGTRADFDSLDVADMANGFGLHDLAGNVAEWCWDWHLNIYYENSPAANPRGPQSGAFRIVRGGSWFSPAYRMRCFARDSLAPDNRTLPVGHVGLRCVRSLEVLP